MTKKVSIPSLLLSKVKTEDKTRFKQDYQEANFVLDVMKDAIEAKLEEILNKEESEIMFSEPGYTEHYAYLMGKRKMAKEILHLFPN